MVWLRFFAFGVMYLLFGAFVFGHALFDQWTYNEILQHGQIATAQINEIKYNGGASGTASNAYYTSQLMWLDKSGQPRTYGTPLSIEFVRSITQGVDRVKSNITIKYLEENSYARPLVIGDERQRENIVSNDIRWGSGLFLSSLALIVVLCAVRWNWFRRKVAQ